MPISIDQIVTRDKLSSDIDFLSGAVLLIDKPLEWTSFDVVNKIRFKLKRSLGVKKIKVGHAGTLDPLATGLLILCTGKLTKEIDTIQAIDKCYSGSMFLGATTATYDSEVPPNEIFDISHIETDALQSAADTFLGYIEQKPPIYSAIKIDGQAAYSLARRGKDIEMKSRPVTIHSFDITSQSLPVIGFEVKCSKGTYIRSLAHDFGKSLGAGAFLSSLRREAIGEYSVNDAFSVDEMVAWIENVNTE